MNELGCLRGRQDCGRTWVCTRHHLCQLYCPGGPSPDPGLGSGKGPHTDFGQHHAASSSSREQTSHLLLLTGDAYGNLAGSSAWAALKFRRADVPWASAEPWGEGPAGACCCISSCGWTDLRYPALSTPHPTRAGQLDITGQNMSCAGFSSFPIYSQIHTPLPG